MPIKKVFVSEVEEAGELEFYINDKGLLYISLSRDRLDFPYEDVFTVFDFKDVEAIKHELDCIYNAMKSAHGKD